MLGLAILGLITVPAGAETAATWTRTASLDASFSVDTPCNAADIKRDSDGGREDFSGLEVQYLERVDCSKDQQSFQAATLGRVEPSQLTSGLLFDALVKKMELAPRLTGHARITDINGRRSWLKRNVENGVAAQVGIIEVGPDSVALLIGGVERDSVVDASDGLVLVDRFFASFSVNAE